MAKASKQILQNVAPKLETGEISSNLAYMGASFDNVIDTRADSEHYTLAQFFDGVKRFFKENDYIYSGPIEPKNNHIKLWIDTGHNNFGEEI